MSPEMLYIMGLEAGEGGCTAEQRIGKNGFQSENMQGSNEVAGFLLVHVDGGRIP